MNRRDFIRASTAGLAAATIPAANSGTAADNIVREAQLGGLRSANPSDLQGLVGDGRQRRILLRGGVVLSLDPRVGDFEKADVLIDG
ncbi:MAG TPA: twin-arginine translocation signal domain-containing protein, partial [Myxococcaceae bacterium]|nr:twin-arginine translocation signal domain-containing protein [Myxococcaceae bacterium]